MQKHTFNFLLISTIISPMLASDGFSPDDMEAAILASMENVSAQQPGAALMPLPAGSDTVSPVSEASKLPNSVAVKLDRSRIKLAELQALGVDLVSDALAARFTQSDIAYINHVLFGIPVPETYVILQAASEVAVAKMMALQHHPDVEVMKEVVKDVLRNFAAPVNGSAQDVHQHDTFCAAKMVGLLDVAKVVGFGKSNFQAEVEQQRRLGEPSDEVLEITVKFFTLFSKERVRAEHGTCDVEGDEWIKAAVNKASEDANVLSLVVYTVSILDDLKGLKGDPIFDHLQYTALQQIMENYKEQGGCFQGVRNRAMKSLAMILGYILNA